MKRVRSASRILLPIVVSIAVLVPASNAAPLDPIPARVVVNYPEAGGIRLGNGVSSTSLDPTARFCVTGGRGDHPINSNEVLFRQVVDNSGLSDTLNISASARYRGLKAATSYVHSTLLKESDTNIAVVGHFDLREEFISSDPSLPRLDAKEPAPAFSLVNEKALLAKLGKVSALKAANDIFAAGSAADAPILYGYTAADESIGLTRDAVRTLRRKGVEAFRRECGDYFVAGVIHGGRFDGLLTARDTSRDERTAISASLKGSFGFGSFSTSASRIVQNLRSNSRLDLGLRSEGSGPTANPTTTEAFINFVKDFPSSVAIGAKPIRLVLQSYQSLADYRKHSQTLPRSIELGVDQYMRLEHLRRNAAQSSNQPNDFVFLGRISSQSLKDLADDISRQETLLSGALQTCETDLTLCKYPDNIPTSDYEARRNMPLTATEWPWARRVTATRARLMANTATLSSTPSIVRNCTWHTRWGRTKHYCSNVPNPRYQQLSGAVTYDTHCLALLEPVLLPLYIHDRIDRWVLDPWLTRSETSDDARSELSYAAVDGMRRAEFQRESIPYVERPVPPTCSWAV